jgi:hypothetical protein
VDYLKEKKMRDEVVGFVILLGIIWVTIILTAVIFR